MRYDPTEPTWPDRDRFVLSCGHACILLYSMLYLTGYGAELDDLRQFRQLHSRTPGHPEVHDLPGIEVTTGPLGQGFANGVGLGHRRAHAAGPVRPRRGRPPHLRHLQRRRPHGGHQPRGGIPRRPSRPRPAHLRLRRQPHHHRRPHRARPRRRRRQALRGLRLARRAPGRGGQRHRRPRSGRCAGPWRSRTAPACSSCAATSAGPPRTRPTAPRPTARRSAPTRSGPPRRSSACRPTRPSGCPTRCSPCTGEAIPRRRGGPPNVGEAAGRVDGGPGRSGTPCWAGRGVPGWAGQAARPGRRRRAGRDPPVHQRVPSTPFVDLVPGAGRGRRRPDRQHRDQARRQPSCRAREHPEGTADRLRGPRARHGRRHERHGRTTAASCPSGAPSSSSATTCGVRSGWPPSRQAKVIYFWTHDSVGLGEDGPTHQPIEQLAALRAMPGLRVIRPADANETAHALRVAIERDGPTALILTRQDDARPGRHRRRGRPRSSEGAYVLVAGGDDPDVVLVGTGSRGVGLRGRGRVCSPRRASPPGWCPCRAGSCSRSRTTTTRTRCSGTERLCCRSRRPHRSDGPVG